MAIRHRTREMIDQVAFTVAVIAAALCINKLFNPTLLSWIEIAIIIVAVIPVVTGIRLGVYYRRKRQMLRDMAQDH
jgi:Flp pilus assembly protein TadB